MIRRLGLASWVRLLVLAIGVGGALLGYFTVTGKVPAQVEEGLYAQLLEVARLEARRWEQEGAPRLAFAPELSLRLSLFDRAGRALADTHVPARSLPDQLREPEIQAALASGQGRARRFSPAWGGEMLCVAVPVHRAGAQLGFVRASASTALLVERSRGPQEYAVGVFVLMGVATVLLASAFAAILSRPLIAMARVLREGGDEPVAEQGPREIRDLVSGLNRMRAQLRRHHADLALQQDHLERILGSVQDPLLVCDDRGAWVFLNGPARALLDSAGDSPVADAAGSLAAHLRQLMTSGGEGKALLDLPVPDRHLALHTLSIPWGPRRSARLALLREITAFVRTDRMRQEFVANASHELRTPVAAVSAALEALEIGAAEDPASRDFFLARAREAVERLTALTRDLLDLASAESAAPAEDVPRTDAVAVARDVAALFLPLAQAAGRSLRLVVPPGVLRVAVPGRDLARALSSVVENALRFAPPDSAVEIVVETTPGWVALRVLDEGPGIPPGQSQRIFERFYRAPPVRPHAGAGLGLSIARRLVQRGGGSMGVSRAPGGGARVSIELPRVPDGS